MSLAAKFRARIREVVASTPAIARAAAPLIEARLRADATTRRGNVPQFPPLGPRIPITAEAVGSQVQVRAAGWVMRKVAQKGETVEWVKILRSVTRRKLAEGRR